MDCLSTTLDQKIYPACLVVPVVLDYPEVLVVLVDPEHRLHQQHLLMKFANYYMFHFQHELYY